MFTWPRGLPVNLGFCLFRGLAAAFARTALMTWWRYPVDQLHGRMGPNVFDCGGVVPYAYTFFAIALAVALGVFTRRVVVSIAGIVAGLVTGTLVGLALLQILAGVFDPPADVPAIPLGAIAGLVVVVLLAAGGALLVADHGIARPHGVGALR